MITVYKSAYVDGGSFYEYLGVSTKNLIFVSPICIHIFLLQMLYGWNFKIMTSWVVILDIITMFIMAQRVLVMCVSRNAKRIQPVWASWMYSRPINAAVQRQSTDGSKLPSKWKVTPTTTSSTMVLKVCAHIYVYIYIYIYIYVLPFSSYEWKYDNCALYMMTSWWEHIIDVTGSLCRESNNYVLTPTQWPVMERAFMVSLWIGGISFWIIKSNGP